MNLDLVNNLWNNLKENQLVQNFIKELSNYLEKNLTHNTEISRVDDTWNNLLADNLEIGDQKIIAKYKDKILMERINILQNYALKTKHKGEMYYIYSINTNEKNTCNLCICKPSKSHEVITKKIEDLPKGTSLGSVLRKQGEDFILEKEDTEIVKSQINNMIKEKIREQDQYLDSKRIDGHIYVVDEKYSGRIWLYDLNNKAGEGIEGIEEIKFPPNLYEIAKKGDKFIYRNGKYQKEDESLDL